MPPDSKPRSISRSSSMFELQVASILFATYTIRQVVARGGISALLVMLLVSRGLAASMAAESGLPSIQVFEPSDYQGAAQNWAVTQDPQGVIYVGNGQAGVLAFDGARWSRIGIPNFSAVRSLATDAEGRVFVGAVGEFGYLAPDDMGRTRYVSLVEQLSAEDRDFTDVWQVLPAEDGVYFSTYTRLFKLGKEKVSVWKPGSSFHFAFLARNQLFLREVDRGLLRMVDAALVPVVESERFAHEKIYAVLPWPGQGSEDDAVLIGTRTQGWLVFDGASYRSWPTEVDDAVKRNQIYGARWLDDGTLAIATLEGGLFILNKEGRLLRHVTEATGLPDDVVYGLFQDKQRGLWLALNTGLARIELGSPLTRFDKRLGLQATVQSVQRHGGHLFAGTAKGLFRLDPGETGGARFSQVSGVPGQNWALLDLGQSLLVATGKGVFEIAGQKATLVRASDKISFSLLRSARNPSRVFVGLQDGLASMRQEGGGWVDEGHLPGLVHSVHTIFEEPSGNLWIGKRTGGVTEVALRADDGSRSSIWDDVVAINHGFERGLPRGSIAVFPVRGHARFAGTSGGILLFDRASGRFVADPSFAPLLRQEASLQVSPVLDVGDRVWMVAEDRASGREEVRLAMRDGDPSYRWIPVPLQPIAGHGVNALFADPDGITWFGGARGLYRFDPKVVPTRDRSFGAYIRTVSAGSGHLPVGPRGGRDAPRIAYEDNSMRIEFSAPSFDSWEATQFQVRMEGLDETWSDWSTETYRDYTNLREGEYRFLLRAKDVYGFSGAETAYSFRVLAPWYRTPWAYAGFAGLLSTVAWLGFRWRLSALRRHNLELARLVEVRTEELSEANRSLVEQAVTDPLTGLRNRRFLRTHIAEDLALVRRFYRGWERSHGSGNNDMVFLMIDIDHFKEVNDRYGHASGDRVLEQMRDILLRACRSSDVPLRWGGEEFLVLGRFMDRNFASAFAERIRSLVALHPFELENGQSIRRTCSIGFACYPFLQVEVERLDWEEVVAVADHCLLAAKRAGRNAWVGVETSVLPPGAGTHDAEVLPLKVLHEVGPVHVLTSIQDPQRLDWRS